MVYFLSIVMRCKLRNANKSRPLKFFFTRRLCLINVHDRINFTRSINNNLRSYNLGTTPRIDSFEIMDINSAAVREMLLIAY